MLPPMLALRLSVAAVVASSLLAVALASCATAYEELWVCNNPVNGKADPTIFDPNHYVNGTADPCHCFDPCGELPQCPILVNDGGPMPGVVCADAGADAP
jgi:hypothetical protein